MKFSHFTTKRAYYASNHQEATNLQTVPATITRTTGEEEPGVVILVGRRVKLAMNQAQAYTLASNIADALAVNHSTSNSA